MTGNNNHKKNEQSKTDNIGIPNESSRNWSVNYCLNQKKKQSSAVKSRKWKKIYDGEVNGNQSYQRKQVNKTKIFGL